MSPNLKRVYYPLLIFVGSLFAMAMTLETQSRPDDFVLFWPVAGLQLAILVAARQKTNRRTLDIKLAGAAGVMLGGMLGGLILPVAALITLMSVVDLWLGSMFLSHSVSSFDDLKHGKIVWRFGEAALLVPMATAAFGAIYLAHVMHGGVLRVFVQLWISRSVGIGLVFPGMLYLITGDYKLWRHVAPHRGKVVLALMLFLGVVGFAFWQTSGPYLFVVFPPMILLITLLGLEGAVIGSWILTAVGRLGTLHGHGPVWLMRGSNSEQRLLALQIFVWVCVATAMPVGALLDERRRAEKQAAKATWLFQTLLHNTEAMIVLSTMEGSQRYISPAVERLTGWTAEEYVLLDRMETVHPEDREAAEAMLSNFAKGVQEQTIQYRAMRKDGGSTWVEATVRMYGGPNEGPAEGYVGTIRDISDLKRAQDVWVEEREVLSLEHQRMAELASTDALTGVANRRGLDEVLQQYEQSMPAALSVLMIDVDYFKLYNDTYGHQAGDECLCLIAAMIRAKAGRGGDVVARVGGEEFVVLLPGTDAAGGRVVAEEILNGMRALAIPHSSSPRGWVTVSVGLAAEGRFRVAPAVLLQLADEALYASKRSGRCCVTLYESDLTLA